MSNVFRLVKRQGLRAGFTQPLIE